MGQGLRWRRLGSSLLILSGAGCGTSGRGGKILEGQRLCSLVGILRLRICVGFADAHASLRMTQKNRPAFDAGRDSADRTAID